MLDGEGQERYTYEKSFEEAKWDEIVIIHTSGTTGKLNRGLSMKQAHLF
jgi:acyl-coenzyme A synthetase/AMP-(fatty) acid ligase